MAGTDAAGQVARVREFNRFYTRRMGLLDEGLLRSGFPLSEARVLFELARRRNPAASDLARDLGLDPGYLSRMLKGLEARGLISRAASPGDARRSVLALTPEGRKAYNGLDRAARREVAGLLRPLDPARRQELTRAMDAVQDLLDPAPEDAILLRPLAVGDIGRIIQAQGLLYAREYGWDWTFEGLLAEILGSFVKNFEPRLENAWVAESRGRLAGSVFVVRGDEGAAKLRLLYVEAWARGRGLGRRLAREAIAFARARGYARLTLWTNDILTAARRLYESEGFRLVAEEPHHSFGKDLLGQYWRLDL